MEEQKAPLCPELSSDDLKQRVAEASKYAQDIAKSPFATKKVKQAVHLRSLSLEYRLGSAYQGEDALDAPDEQLLSELRIKALAWKRKEIFYGKSPDLQLTDAELLQLRELARYPKYLTLLLQDSRLLKRFFKWSVLNSLSVKIFVEFPSIVRKIEHCHLKTHIGAFGGSALQCVESDGKKDVTLLMEGKAVSILDTKTEVQFSHGLSLTVEKIFTIFRRKYVDESFLAFFEDGIRNWDAHRQSPVRPDGSLADEIDLEDPDWYKKLPMKAHYTLEEAQAKCSPYLDGENWGFTLVATRSKDKLNTFGSHSFFRILIPDGNGGYDYTFGWGKFTKKYPKWIVHLLSYLCGTKEAVIEYPDNNERYKRQVRERTYTITAEKGKGLLESLRKNLKNAKIGNLAFQILVHNCTDWVVHKMVKFVHEEGKKLFDMHFLDLELAGPFGLIVKIARKAPEKSNRIFFRILGVLLMGHRKIVLRKKNGEVKQVISVRKIPPYEKRFQHPGMLFRNLEAKN